LADAQSANEAWHDIKAAVKAWAVADANEKNAHSGVLMGLQAAFITAVNPAWVTYANAVSDAEAALAVASTGAYAAVIGRWAGAITNGSPFPAYVTAYQAAVVARTGVTSAADATYARTTNAAKAAWVTTVLPGWVAYQDHVTDHAAAAVATIAPAWETYQNAIDDADLA